MLIIIAGSLQSWEPKTFYKMFQYVLGRLIGINTNVIAVAWFLIDCHCAFLCSLARLIFYHTCLLALKIYVVPKLGEFFINKESILPPNEILLCGALPLTRQTCPLRKSSYTCIMRVVARLRNGVHSFFRESFEMFNINYSLFVSLIESL